MTTPSEAAIREACKRLGLVGFSVENVIIGKMNYPHIMFAASLIEKHEPETLFQDGFYWFLNKDAQRTILQRAFGKWFAMDREGCLSQESINSLGLTMIGPVK